MFWSRFQGRKVKPSIEILLTTDAQGMRIPEVGKTPINVVVSDWAGNEIMRHDGLTYDKRVDVILECVGVLPIYPRYLVVKRADAPDDWEIRWRLREVELRPKDRVEFNFAFSSPITSVWG